MHPSRTGFFVISISALVVMAAGASSVGCGKKSGDTAAGAASAAGTEGAAGADDEAGGAGRSHDRHGRTRAQNRGAADRARGHETGARDVIAPNPEQARAAGQTADAPVVVGSTSAVVQTGAGTPGADRPTEAGSVPPAGRAPEAGAPARPDPSRPALADPRLLLTMVDISKVAPARARFTRAALAGLPRTDDSDSLLYVPERGTAFGFSLQLFRTRNAQETKRRFETLQASYPNSQEISSVSGKTFFSYWDEVMHIAFVHQAKNMVVVVSCGREYCDSNKLMELAGTVADRLK